MRKIRIGVICPSEIAFRRFLPSLQKSKDFEYVGVSYATDEEWFGEDWCNVDSEYRNRMMTAEREKAEKFQKEFGGDVIKGYGNMAGTEQVDAVYLPLPPALHYKWAKLALQCGKHVFVEKPSTLCMEDTQHLVALSEQKELALHENYMFVFHNQIKAVSDIINRGEIGDVRLYRITFGFPQRAETDFRYNKSLGGGALLDAGGYTIKLATMLLGDDVQLTSATAGYKSGFGVDIYGAATMESSNGIVAQLAFGMDNDYRCDLEVWGSKGTFSTTRIMTAPDGFAPSYTIKKNQEVEKGILPADDAFLKSIEHFGLCVREEDVRKSNYQVMLLQERLVEEYKQMSKLQ